MAHHHDQHWISENSGNFDDFLDQLNRETQKSEVPQSADICKNIPIYDGAFVRKAALNDPNRRQLMSEWTNVFSAGAGIIVIRDAMPHLDIIDQATEIFETLIQSEKKNSAGGGDHFAKAGANDRVWNALEKHCLANPENFAQYYSTDAIAIASQAWLGLGYQVTAQINRVNPGGSAQKPHRDYHLGFMSPQNMMQYPKHIHSISPALTLQGAVAHCDMPIESGPTQFLPFSQHFYEGYIAFGREEFQKHFENNFVQLALKKGDVIFFNPAVMHGAGENKSSSIFRMANLLQVSSAFGRAMETVNRFKMCQVLYPVMLAAKQNATLSDNEIANVIASSAEGYSFPTNLDLDPPIGGMAPKTMAQIIHKALESDAAPQNVATILDELKNRQKS